MNNPDTFEAVMAVYGVPDQNDNILRAVCRVG